MDDRDRFAQSADLLRRVITFESVGKLTPSAKRDLRKRILSGELKEVGSELDDIDSGKVFNDVGSDEEQLQRVKATGLLRVTKNLATKVGGSASGKKLIRKHLGEAGTQIFEALFIIVERRSGAEKSEELQTSIFTLALKAASLFNSKGAIDAVSVNLCVPPLRACVRSLIDQIELTFCFNPSDLVDQCFVMTQAIEGVLELGISEKNIGKLRSVGDYFGDVDFFTELLKDRTHQQETDSIALALRSLQQQQQPPPGAAEATTGVR